MSNLRIVNIKSTLNKKEEEKQGHLFLHLRGWKLLIEVYEWGKGEKVRGEFEMEEEEQEVDNVRVASEFFRGWKLREGGEIVERRKKMEKGGTSHLEEGARNKKSSIRFDKREERREMKMCICIYI